MGSLKTVEFKQNKTLRAGAVCVLVSLITLIALSFTFAKYVSEGSGQDDARVAKWGLGISTPQQLDLFSKAYNAGGGPAEEGDTSFIVESGNGDKVVAPGTHNDVQVAAVTYKDAYPEVMYDFDVDLKVEDGSGHSLIQMLDSNPAYTWNVVDFKGDSHTFNSTEALINFVRGLSQKDVAPNTAPNCMTSGNYNNYLKIGWNWDFENPSHESPDTDGIDTSMGNMAASGELSNIKVTFTINATQCQGGHTPDPRQDPGIIVPTYPVEIALGETIDIEVAKASSASWSTATSSDSTVATVTGPANGEKVAVTGVAEGKALITVSVPEVPGAYVAGSKTFEVKVTNTPPTPEEKAAAVAEVNAVKEAAVAAVNNLEFITAAQKAASIASINESAQTAIDAINAATTKSAINTAKNTGITKINTTKDAAQAADDSQKAAYKEQKKNDLSTYATTNKGTVDTLPFLTDKNKAIYNVNIDSEASSGATAIDAATTKNNIDSALDTAEESIDNEVDAAKEQDKEDETDCKNDAKDKLYSYDSQICEKIADLLLSYEQITGYQGDIDNIRDAANGNVDNATKKEDVASAVNTGKSSMDTKYTEVETVAEKNHVVTMDTASLENGSASANTQTSGKEVPFATEDSTVIVTYTYEPNEGENYILDTVTITYTKEGETITITATISADGKTATFTMPDADATITVKEKAASKTIYFKNVDGHDYYPVFNSVPTGVTFYNNDGKPINSMSPEIHHATVPNGVTIYTLRSIETSWNRAFQSPPKTPGISPGITSGLKSKLVDGNEIKEQVYPAPYNPKESSHPKPTYNGVELTAIWEVYKNDGFGGSLGFIWSSCAGSSDAAYYWFSFGGGFWTDTDRVGTEDIHVLVRRAF